MSLREPMILSVSGRDRPGVLAALAGVLSESGIDLVDIEQATLQDFLALSFLVDLSEDAARSQAILHRFFAAAGEWGLQVQVRPLSPAEVQELRSTNLWALTVLGAAAAAGTVAALAAVTSDHQANIVSIRRLAESDIRAAEFLLDVARVPDPDALRRDLIQESERLGVDIALAPEAIYRQSKRVVVMDGDSTLIAGEVIDEMARLAGVAPEVSRITERAMAGELDFAEALRARVKLLAGLDRAALERLADAIPLTPGAEETIRVLQRLGYKVGVISGGFTFALDRLRVRLDLDYTFGNTLEWDGDRLTGRVLEPILDAEGKARRLREIAACEGVPLSQVIGIGDGANDIPMLRTAGLGIAFCAKESTRRAAHAAIHRNSLSGLLSLLGVSHRALADLLEDEAP